MRWSGWHSGVGRFAGLVAVPFVLFGSCWGAFEWNPRIGLKNQGRAVKSAPSSLYYCPVRLCAAESYTTFACGDCLTPEQAARLCVHFTKGYCAVLGTHSLCVAEARTRFSFYDELRDSFETLPACLPARTAGRWETPTNGGNGLQQQALLDQ